MDDRYARQPIARWYLAGAVLSLLLMLLICAAYAVHLATDPASLPLDERAIYLAEPAWVSFAFGSTGLAGAVGALLLLVRRKAAQHAMLVSLAAVLIWFAGLIFVPQLRALLETGEIAMAIAVVALVWTIYWFARHSRQRGWLS